MKFDMSLIKETKAFSKSAHYRQKRKYTDEDYFNHVDEVATIVSHVPWAITEMVCAALLHDVLEDCELCYKEGLYTKFSQPIVKLVEELTDDNSICGNRFVRKRHQAEILSRVSREAQTIKCADLISNTRSIVEHDKKFSKVYIPEARWLLIKMTKADSQLRGSAWLQILNAENILQ